MSLFSSFYRTNEMGMKFLKWFLLRQKRSNTGRLLPSTRSEYIKPDVWLWLVKQVGQIGTWSSTFQALYQDAFYQKSTIVLFKRFFFTWFYLHYSSNGFVTCLGKRQTFRTTNCTELSCLTFNRREQVWSLIALLQRLLVHFGIVF